MKGLLSKSQVVEKTLSGIIKAHKQYVKMSGGDWLCWAPEYFMTSHIAQALYNAQGSKYVTIENGAYSALSHAGAVGRGRLHSDIRSGGRFDLLLWWAKGDPRAIIEVKNSVFNKTQYKSDLKRITSVLERKRNESSIEFGIFAFYTATDDSSKRKSTAILEQRMTTIQNNAQSIVGNQFKTTLHTSNISIDNKSAWFAGCILVEHA